MSSAVPTFYLYGEPHRVADVGFVHVEALDDRSRPSEWTIQPHAHADLVHIFYIAEGGGTMTADGQGLGFTAPTIVTVPVRVVHGFSWTTNSSGWVATLSQAELGTILRDDPELSPLFALPHVVGLDDDGANAVATCFGTLLRELAWALPGRRAAMRSTVEALIVLTARRAIVTRASAAQPGRHAALVARYRQRIEERFRLREPVSVHAGALGVSESALRAACAAIAGVSPAAMLDERAMLEARRSLIYSNLSVAEVGWSLGFPDPAYFSRFFSRHTGQSARAYRQGHTSVDHVDSW